MNTNNSSVPLYRCFIRFSILDWGILLIKAGKSSLMGDVL